MRILLFFDLPVKTKKQRRDYTRFRNYLLDEGFDMMQFSVYCRLCNGHESMERLLEKVKKNLPPKGSIRALPVTEKQYDRMRLLLGKKTANEERVTINQLSLF
ncbi:CRISPR-associated endonuclease Cas2 [Oceanobacillus bengalensis]|uniref:CRISPR-associated endoribonuclease Cas2 n=1 Tax=Oceanobacillus bengalensis TaxID=1435466 RepID=A0A494YSX0_9BACI|nr:CRISPR-associated endonuclease Cas2 [Oceanobacillus bengalensis]RKQ13218.1 CRISPR-associated endonuclease Cas2 [Oceanobacillus bengalensis]